MLTETRNNSNAKSYVSIIPPPDLLQVNIRFGTDVAELLGNTETITKLDGKGQYQGFLFSSF